MIKQIKISFYFTTLSTLGLGVVYPAVLSGVALIIPSKAPSLLSKPIEQDDLFHGRPSMSGGAYSGASNLSLASSELAKQVGERMKKITKDAPGVLIPRDLLFASASGYDPHISPEAARFQINQISRARIIDSQQLDRLIDQHTQRKLWGFIGSDKLDINELNAALNIHKQ